MLRMVLTCRASRAFSRLLLPAGVACSPQYQLLETLEAAGGFETGGASAGTGGPTESPSGGTGVAAGGSETTEGGASGADEGGGQASSAGGDGASAGGSGPPGTACATHDDCASGSRCSSYQCVPCAALAASCPKACADGFELVTVERNGCSSCECAPRSECTSSADCAIGEACYRGAQCREGCDGPSCCFGNRCGRAGCSTLPAACLAFGCSDGHECLAACDETTCTCDGESWVCESTTGGDAVTSCPQACAPL